MPVISIHEVLAFFYSDRSFPRNFTLGGAIAKFLNANLYLSALSR
ncbi:hypothetical protein [Tumidithrix helvetica]